ncbi:coiled-coil domain-containing protein R3HCC1L [Caerostris darwini]|uniref:Coiled-coil domain-containing protein R3HCC1L n=1 Tax=Caerostris darwini TaxID=1538125 RepID=A0AAV4RX38_9ARAC|nr:coiled-coil domain-containing protein R3HCC1L [Caerostris darwini]
MCELEIFKPFFSKLAVYIEGRYLVNDELKFAKNLKEDLDNFVFDRQSESVLIFPPFESKYRYLAHKIIDELFFPTLCSFSIGQENKRRFIAGWTSFIARCCLPYRCVHEKLNAVRLDEKFVTCICFQRLKSLNFHKSSTNFSSVNKPEIMKDLKSKRDVSSASFSKKNISGATKSTVKERQKRPDMQLYVPRALRGIESTSNKLNSIEAENSNGQSSKLTSVTKSIVASSTKSDDLPSEDKLKTFDSIGVKPKQKVKISFDTKSSEEMVLTESETVTISISNFNETEEQLNIPEIHLSSSPATDESNNLNDFEKLTPVQSITAIISEKISDKEDTEKDDSWESMFNDDGECLNSDFLKELNSVTGKIQIHAAKNSYSDYQPLSESGMQEFENILELYNFPREFTTQDLVSAFCNLRQSCFSIKWVDDTHALAIFTSPSLANQALQINHPFLKVRPVSDGTTESLAKARWFSCNSEPQKPRPATSAVLARRLVSQALGVKDKATKEQKDFERNVLKEAKEKRRQKAKQKEAIWDGSVV